MIIHGLILAAGESKRLGQPKQLLTYKGQTLLARVHSQLEPLLSDVHVVLGANESIIKKQVTLNHTISNPNWQQGMGSSLSFGIKNLPDCDALLVALCDQALIPDSHYKRLIETAQKHADHIIATQHTMLGVPAVFPQHHFNKLKNLQHDQGAKSIIKQSNMVKAVVCREANYDLDTIDDLNRLNG